MSGECNPASKVFQSRQQELQVEEEEGLIRHPGQTPVSWVPLLTPHLSVHTVGRTQDAPLSSLHELSRTFLPPSLYSPGGDPWLHKACSWGLAETHLCSVAPLGSLSGSLSYPCSNTIQGVSSSLSPLLPWPRCVTHDRIRPRSNSRYSGTFQRWPCPRSPYFWWDQHAPSWFAPIQCPSLWRLLWAKPPSWWCSRIDPLLRLTVLWCRPSWHPVISFVATSTYPRLLVRLEFSGCRQEVDVDYLGRPACQSSLHYW